MAAVFLIAKLFWYTWISQRIGHQACRVIWIRVLDTKVRVDRRLHATEILMLRWRCEVTRMDRIRNEYISRKDGRKAIDK
jgi:hypothetical protein